MDSMTIDEAQDFLKAGEVFKCSEPEYVGKFVVIDPMDPKPVRDFKVTSQKGMEGLQADVAAMDGVTDGEDGVSKIRRGRVWCTKCGRSEKVNTQVCFAHGWPECCDETMTLDSPEERNG
jgi:hypothetical protein